MYHQDCRGNTPMNDAIREDRKHIIDYLNKQNYIINEDFKENDDDLWNI